MKIIGVQYRIGNDLDGGLREHVERFYRRSSPGDILVFPEDTGLLTAFSGIRARSTYEAIQELYSLNKEEIDNIMRERDIGNTISAIFLSLTEKFVAEFYDLFSSLSREYSVYTVTCNNMAKFVKEVGKIKIIDNSIYNTAFVFNPSGNLIFQQDKVFLTQMEKDLGISSGKISGVSTFSIEGKEIGIAISLDAFSPQYVARLERAEVVIQPDANPVKWNSFLENGRWQPEEWMESAYYIAQRLGTVRYVVNPMMVGSLLDIRFEGQSSITKKAEGTDGKMSYIGNIPSTGFHSIVPLRGYSPEEYVARDDILNKELEMEEGVVEVEI